MLSGQDSEGNAKPIRADSRFAPSQRETALLCNYVSDWLGTRLELALNAKPVCLWHCVTVCHCDSVANVNNITTAAICDACKNAQRKPSESSATICRRGYFWTFPNNVWPPATVLQSHATSLRRMQKHWESRATLVQSHCDMGIFFLNYLVVLRLGCGKLCY